MRLSNRLILTGVVLEVLYLAFYVSPESADEVLLFIAVNAIAFGLYAYLVFTSKEADTISSKQAVWLIIGFAVLFRVTLVFHPPVGSDDIYRYVWDGKVAAEGINPFRYAPVDSILGGLHSEEISSKINFPEMRTIYPPLAQVLFYVSNVMFGDSLFGLKLFLILFDVLSILMLYRFFDESPRGVLLYAWSPIPVMYFALDGHIDALGIPFLLLCLAAVKRNRLIAGVLTLGLAGLAKLYPLFIVPFFLKIANGWKELLLAFTPIIMLIVGCWFYWEETGGLLESFRVFSATFEFNGSIFHIADALVSTNEKAHLASAILFVVWIGCVFFVERGFNEKVFLSFLGFVIFAPVVQPWYLSWLAVLVVVRWSTAVFWLLGLSNISNFVVYQYRLTGVWEDNVILLVLEYVPFYLLIMRDVLRGEFSPPSPNIGRGSYE